MRSSISRIEQFLVSHIVFLLRLAGTVSVISGLVGGFIWAVALEDRSDGDDLRWGFFHNPFMQFPPYNESFLDLSLWILFACSAAAGLGGLMLLALRKWGIPLVVWQARISIVINTAVVVLIVAIMIGSARERRPEAFTTLELRIGSIVIDLLLWMFLRTSAVREFFVQRAHPLGHAFEVITDDAPSGAAHSSTCSHDLER